MPVQTNRDNQYPTISLQQSGSSSITVPPNTEVLSNNLESNRKLPALLAPSQTGNAGSVTFELQPGTTAEFPPGTTPGILRLTLVENLRTPVKLPPNIFGSAIIQISDFGVRLNPGGKLTFPNTDKLPAGTQAILYRLDQRRMVNGQVNPTLGEFIVSGNAMVSPDGRRFETAINAVEETTIYFVAAPRLTTTVIGRVLDSDGKTPLRLARVRCRSQEALSDGNGGFTIRDVLVNEGNDLSVEASFERSSLLGRVDRIQSALFRPVINGITDVGNLVLPLETSNRPPVVLAPTSLEVTAGESRTINIVAGDPDPGDSVPRVEISGAPFVLLTKGSDDVWNMRITPDISLTGTYTLFLKAFDNHAASLTLEIPLKVYKPPVANEQQVTINEDTTIPITLTGNDPNGLPLSYVVVNLPARGQLSGAAPKLTYRPADNYNGSDSFTFRVNNSISDSAPATVSIFVNPVNDAPVLTVPDKQTIDEGKNLSFTVSATDIENDLLEFSLSNAPAGAKPLAAAGTNSARFEWNPNFTQAGTYKVTFTVLDSGTPRLSASKDVVIEVKDVNQPPNFNNLPMQKTVNSGNRFDLTIVATDPDAGQTPVISPMNPLPSGAEFDSKNGLFSWTPKFLQTGTHVITFKASDSGSPVQTVTADLTITVVGQWAKAGPLEGGPITALLVKDTNIFAGVDGGGIFRSSIQDQRWTQVLANHDVRAFTTVGNTIFAGTLDAGVLRSSDQGQTWTPVNNGLTKDAVLSLAVMDTTIFAGTFGGGVFRTTDQGQKWDAVGLTDMIVRALVVKDTNLFAGTDNGGVFLLANQSQSWQPTGLTNTRVFALAVHRANLFAGTGDRVIRSMNNGQSWEQVRSGMDQNTPVDSLLSDGTNLYAGTYYGVFLTSNNGDNWMPVNTNLETRIFSIVSSGTNLFASTVGAGVFRSPLGGQSWTKYSNGLTAMSVHALIAADSNTILAGTWGGGLFRSTNNGQTWEIITSTTISPFAFINAFEAIDNTIFAGGDGLGILRSTDKGRSWEEVNKGLDDPRDVLALAVSRAANNTTLFASTYRGVFRSANLGQSWTRVSTGLPDRGVISLAVIGQNLFAGTDGFGVYDSANQGDSWSAVNNGLTEKVISALAVRGTDLFAGTTNGVFRLPDLGRNWIPILTSIDDPEVRAFVVNGQTLYAGTGGSGVFRLSDDNQSWSAVNGNGNGKLTNTFIKSFLINDMRIFVGTVGGGVFIGQ